MAITCRACQSENPGDSRFCHRCGTAIDLTASPTMTFSPAEEAASREALKFNPGDKFGERYTIVEEIGHGGMGRVYKAKDHELDTTVVLKMIRPELTSRPGMIDQFRKETLLGRSVSHENVVRIHDLGEIDKIRYISMDFIKGENLGELIQTSGTLTLSTCLQIAIQVCHALQAAHKIGIVHQDLKPQNIMIDNSGKVYVTDFGLAKSLSLSRPRRPGTISGTPKYFSPEQARGEESDPRSDIYSLGVILYEMVTGAVPFRSDTVEGFIKKHTSEKPPPPSQINPDVPPACEKIVLKCLEKKREDRYQSVDELLGDLEAQRTHAHGLGLAGSRAIWRERVVVAFLVLAIGFIGFKWIVPRIWPPRPSGQPLVAVMYAVNNSGDKSLDERFRWRIQNDMSTFLNQSKYLRVLRPDRLMSILKDMRQLDEERYVSKTLDKISEIANVSHFVLPRFQKVGDQIWISISVVKAKTDVAIGTDETAKGTRDEDIRPMEEDLSQKVKSKLDVTPAEIAGDYNQSLDRITTPSPKALGHYMNGERYYALGDYGASIKALELAVQEDPSYALAYWKMADGYEYLGDLLRHRAYLQKAQTLLDRVSLRDRYLIQGYSSYVLDESPLNAIRSYQKLIELYPKDEEGRVLLAAIHRNHEDWDLATEQVDRVLRQDPASPVALENKAFIDTARGQYEKALGLCEIGLEVAPDGVFFNRQPPLIHLIQGRYDLASAELEKASARLPGNIDLLELKGNLRQLMGDLPAAGILYDQIQKLGEDSSRIQDPRGRIRLALLQMQQGKFRQAHEGILQGIERTSKERAVYAEIDLRLHSASIDLQIGQYPRAAEALRSALEMTKDNFIKKEPRIILHYSGLAELGMGHIEDAKRFSEQLRLVVERMNYPKEMRRHDHLLGSIALAEGRPDEAIRLFERAITSLPHQRETEDEQAFYIEGLAKAYFQSGNWPKAIETYQKIVPLTTGRLSWGDIYVRSYYWLGQAFQRSGDNAAAAAHFEEFLRQWKDADSGLPEIEDARKQLEALKRVP